RISKRMKILLAVTSLLAVVAVIVVVLLWLRGTDPPRLVLIGAGYETNLAVPHNAYGKRGLGDLKAWKEEYNKTRDPAHSIDLREEELTATSDPFRDALKDCNSASVVVFVAVHGGGSAGQGAYLIPHNASPRDGVAGYSMDKAF